MISIRFLQADSSTPWAPAAVTWSTAEAPAVGDHLNLAPDTRNTGGVRGIVEQRIWVAPGQVMLVGNWTQQTGLATFVELSTEAA